MNQMIDEPNTKDSETKKLVEERKRLRSYEGSDRVITSREMRNELLKEDDSPPVKIASGYPSVDEVIGGGFRLGECHVLSGVTGHGKTLLSQSMTVSFDKQEVVPLWFSFEVSARDFINRHGDNLPHYVLPRMLESQNLKWLEERVHEAKVKHGIETVFIDHLHYLVDFTFRNTSYSIGMIMTDLIKIAQRYNVAIFLIAHIGKKKKGEEVGLEDLRDSSFISQYGANVIFIWRDEKVDNRNVLKIAKARHGNCRGQKINLTKKGHYLYEEIDDGVPYIFEEDEFD